MDKQELRHAALRARGRLTSVERAQAGRAICEQLQTLDALRKARVVFSYQAMPEEVDLSQLHDWLSALGKTVAFPVTGQNGTMEAWAPDETMRFTRDRFGIRTPVAEAARRIDPAEIAVILTPCVAFDGAGRRLGHGGGYYDRFFARCPRAMRVCIAFAAQMLPAIPAEDWDAPMHAVVTEAGILWTK